MNRMIRSLLLAMLTAILVLQLPGCGGRRAVRDVVRPDRPPKEEPAPTPTPTPAPTSPDVPTTSAPAPAPAAKGVMTEASLSHGGLSRSYLLFVPDSYSPSRPVPLVFVFHGGGGNAKGIAETTHMDGLATKNGFIAVFPNGTGRQSSKLTWNAGMSPPQGYAEENNVDDVGFIRKLLAQLKSGYAIDDKRIYATGISKGGMFSYRLGCEMADTFAAIAPVAATLAAQRCNPSEPVNLYHLHGTGDSNVPLNGGSGDMTAKGASYPSALGGIERWSQFNGCSSRKTETKLSYDTTCWAYEGCPAEGAVRYCLIDRGGHAWPGSSPKKWQTRNDVYVTQSFSGSDEIWKFLSSHLRK